jgi:transcriptional regulator with XRE-family HTH domain
MKHTVLGDAIRRFRKARGWTQGQLADACGYTGIANLERGRGGVRLDNLLEIARVLGVSVDALLAAPRKSREQRQ